MRFPILIFLILGLVALHFPFESRRARSETIGEPGSTIGCEALLLLNDALHFQKSVFVSDAGESVDAESGWLVVPESRSRPQGASIKLPVVRFKSTAEKPGYPIIYLAGGPGASGLESAKRFIFPVLMALRARADVVVFDQRGTGNAEPGLVLPGKLDLPLNDTLDSRASRRQLRLRAAEAAAEMRRRGIDLSAYNTNENADDVNDLRLALGTQKITIWGHSYGSHLGLTVLRRHGQFIHRAILGGINGPDQRWRLPNDLQALVSRIDGFIKNTPKLRRQMPSLSDTVASVFKKLEARPATVLVQSGPIVIGKADVAVLTALQAGDLEFVKRLPLIFGRMKEGDFSSVAGMILQGIKQREVGTAMRFSMHIASGVSPERSAGIAAQEARALFGNAINFPFDVKEFVEVWGIKDLGAEFRSPVRSDVPTLFLSGELDGRTSVEDAKEILRGFTNGRHVLIEGVAHDFYHLTPKVLDSMFDFLDGKTTPERITIPFDLRGPDERNLVLELRKLILEKGIDAGIKRLREMSSPGSDSYLTSYVPGTLGFILGHDDQKPAAALAVFQAGVELFPENEFLHERLAEAYLAAGEKPLARKLYERCLQLNRLNRVAYLKLKQT